MNKTKIEWCDSTWNPVTGCYHGCPYCYARNMINRFGKAEYGKSAGEMDVLELYDPIKDENGKRIAYPTGFIPTLHRYRLRLNEYKDKSPRTIFVCSMADLFGDWVPDSWIEEVFAACKAAPQHRYLFLTKNPKRYLNYDQHLDLPDLKNMWYGTTVTDTNTMFFHSDCHNTFLSIEPIMDDFSPDNTLMNINMAQWIIVGAETGNRKDKVVPKKEWIENITEVCKSQGIPLFMKDSLMPIIGEENMIREFPWG